MILDLMQSLILSSLINDEAPLLSLFLTTLKEKIVEDITITKTVKRKMFNTKIMAKFIETYTWRGPEKQKKKSKGDKNIMPLVTSVIDINHFHAK